MSMVVKTGQWSISLVSSFVSIQFQLLHGGTRHGRIWCQVQILGSRRLSIMSAVWQDLDVLSALQHVR